MEREWRFGNDAAAVVQRCWFMGMGLVHMVFSGLLRSALEFFMATRSKAVSSFRDDLVCNCLSYKLWKLSLNFHEIRYSFVFPNTALVTATLAIGRGLNSRPIQIAGTALGGILVFVWFLVFCAMLRALWLRRLLWPEVESHDDRKKEPNVWGNSTKTWRRKERLIRIM